MTKVARLYEEEKIEAINQIIQQKEQEKTEALEKKEQEKTEAVLQIAKKLLKNGVDILDIMEATGLTRKTIDDLSKIKDK